MDSVKKIFLWMFCFTCGSGAESIHNVFAGLQPIPDNRSLGSRVGQALSNYPLWSFEGLLFQTIKIVVIDFGATAQTSTG